MKTTAETLKQIFQENEAALKKLPDGQHFEKIDSHIYFIERRGNKFRIAPADTFADAVDLVAQSIQQEIAQNALEAAQRSARMEERRKKLR